MYIDLCHLNYPPREEELAFYRASDLNKEHQKQWNIDNSPNTFIISIKQGDKHECLLGWMRLCEKSVRDSKFVQIIENNLRAQNINPDDFYKMKAYQISEWQFDKIMKNKVFLTSFFSFITYEIGEPHTNIILWIDTDTFVHDTIENKNCDIVFGVPHIANHFASEFMKLK